MKYKVFFEYSTPEFGNIEVEAEDTTEAEELGVEEFARMYPEAIDIIVYEVKELND